MTLNNWRPGQLVGQNGSDPATIAQSPTFATPNRQNQFSESRSATSTGHLLQFQRPTEVGYGWGDYDQLTYWQSFGRRLTKDMVENKNWQKDPMQPVDRVDESGTVVRPLTIPFKREELPVAQEPLSVYERLDSADTLKPTDNQKRERKRERKRKRKARERDLSIMPRPSNDGE